MNKEKLQSLVTEQDSSILNNIENRLRKPKSLQRSKAVAIRILSRLDELNMSQKDLAESLNISAQQVSKWVKGNENFTFETIERIENILGIKLIFISETPKENTITIKVEELKDYSNVEMKKTKNQAKIIPLIPSYSGITAFTCNC